MQGTINVVLYFSLLLLVRALDFCLYKGESLFYIAQFNPSVMCKQLLLPSLQLEMQSLFGKELLEGWNYFWFTGI